MKYLPIGLLSAYLLKCALISAGPQDAVIILSLAAIQISLNFIEFKRIPELEDKFVLVKNELNQIRIDYRNEIQSLKSQVSSTNLATLKKQENSKFRF